MRKVIELSCIHPLLSHEELESMIGDITKLTVMSNLCYTN